MVILTVTLITYVTDDKERTTLCHDNKHKCQQCEVSKFKFTISKAFLFPKFKIYYLNLNKTRISCQYFFMTWISSISLLLLLVIYSSRAGMFLSVQYITTSYHQLVHPLTFHHLTQIWEGIIETRAVRKTACLTIIGTW